jgi:ribonuclease HII
VAPTLRYERQLLRQGYARPAGVDEVGRGSLAGPVVAAAVILPVRSRSRVATLDGLDDSKRLSPDERVRLYGRILLVAESIGIGWASHHVIDRDGIAAANRRALLRAVSNCGGCPDALLLDHFALPESHLPQLPLTHGDSLSLSIAAASVVAKVVRDRWMARCDRFFPGYGFAGHKGYGTASHRDALARLGPCSLHRRSFQPVAACLP